MTPDQLAGKYARLRHELEQAYAEPLSCGNRSGMIDRIAAELLDLERRLALLQAGSPEAHSESSTAIMVPTETPAEKESSPRLAA
ncbi:MAG TPA: hypothetical protein VJO99_00820 [Burkholderiaceae bacterium]|nr:hypothetical protein [Burkholderiaceae bacterium]